MTSFTSPADYLPSGFRLRKRAGGGDPANGLCFMETVSLIAGEPITDEPECACPVLTRHGIMLNDAMPDDRRQELIGLAWAVAGTRSPEHEWERLKILGLAACDMADLVVGLNSDPRVINAIKATRACWNDPTPKAARAAARAAEAAAEAEDAAWVAARAAEDAAWAAGDAALTAARAARTAAGAAEGAARDAPDQADEIWAIVIDALRRAIQAGPHGGIETSDMASRIEAVRDVLPVMEATAKGGAS